MLLPEKCQIHEFSRKFLEAKWSKKLNQYVTTGFEREIGWETRKVPREIANAVYNNAFRINDNYPPPKEEIALLAREIDKYAVLAVATGLLDDGDRPLVAYRYFWLEKPSRNNMIDGIGTLLTWWIEQDCPCFEFPASAEYQESKPSHYTSFLSKLDLIEKYDLEFQSLLQEIQSNSNNFPIYFPVDNHYFNDEKFHSLALLLNREYKSPINWAFNVDKLESPEQFTMIYTTIYPQGQLIINPLNSFNQLPQQLPIPPSPPLKGGKGRIGDRGCERDYAVSGFDTERENGFFGSECVSRMPEESASFSNEISTDSQLKCCLIELARNKNLDSNFLKLANYLKEIDSYTWNWESILDNTLFNNHHDIATARYRALLAILRPSPEIFRWLSWLKKRGKRGFWQAGINLQNHFLEFLDSQKLSDNTKLDKQIYKIILNLILELLLLDSSPKKSNSLSKEREWLLIKSKSFWESYFKDYAEMLFYQLSFQEFKIHLKVDRFCQEILADWQIWEDNQSLLPEKKYYYELMARLFAQVESYSLAAFFYQLSRGEVPADIYAKTEIRIIPLQKSSRSSGLIGLAISNLKQDIKLLLVNLFCSYERSRRSPKSKIT